MSNYSFILPPGKRNERKRQHLRSSTTTYLPPGKTSPQYLYALIFRQLHREVDPFLQ